MASESVSTGQWLMFAVTNFTISSGTLLGHTQVVALAEGHIGEVCHNAMAQRQLPDVPDDLPIDQRATLTTLLLEHQDVFSQSDNDIWWTHLTDDI